MPNEYEDYFNNEIFKGSIPNQNNKIADTLNEEPIIDTNTTITSDAEITEQRDLNLLQKEQILAKHLVKKTQEILDPEFIGAGFNKSNWIENHTDYLNIEQVIIDIFGDILRNFNSIKINGKDLPFFDPTGDGFSQWLGRNYTEMGAKIFEMNIFEIKYTAIEKIMDFLKPIEEIPAEQIKNIELNNTSNLQYNSSLRTVISDGFRKGDSQRAQNIENTLDYLVVFLPQYKKDLKEYQKLSLEQRNTFTFTLF